MRRSRGYSSYRGRMPFWKVLLMAVMIVIILASGGVILLQRSMVFDGWGIARIPVGEGTGERERVPELDFGTPEDAAGTPQAEDAGTGGTAPENAQTGDAQTDSAASEPGAANPYPNWPSVLGYRIQAAPLTAAIRNDAAAILQAGGYNAASVLLKDEEGTMYFMPPSAADLDNDYSVASDTTEALKSLTALRLADGSTLHTIARIACFHDPWRAQKNVERYGLKNTGTYIFYDGNSSNWTDPAKPAAREFLCGIAKDAAALGFKEILLTAVGYPTEGKLDKIAYGSTPIGENLSAFLSEMRTALEPYGVTLSIELPKSLLIGSGDASGLTLEIAARYADRIYSPVMLAEIGACEAAVAQYRNGSVAFVPELRGALPQPNPFRYLLTT